ncbi:MAG: SDR family oxidoreductase [Deltaproteobacteria bacterium]|nr:SDR family oxidoreductase [Deltaproteobacteria bacterium]
MKSFGGKLAVVTGGGSGMGRELVIALASDGCHVALCDVNEESMAQTRSLARAAAKTDVRVTTHKVDISEERQVIAFRAAVAEQHQAKHIDLLFNNAGIGGGGSFVLDEREEWDKTFAVCWGGVYYCTRAFMPMLLASREAHLINTSSVNGFWASLGPRSAHTAYSAAKFAVKGFTEALINDLRNNAPHVKVSLVMPGHIGTGIVINSSRILGRDPKEMSDAQLEDARERMERMGLAVGAASNEQIRQGLQMLGEAFRDAAPMTAAAAAKVILDGVREERWRILVGADAEVLDRLVRETPEEAYETSFMERLQSQSTWAIGQ